jgi:Fungal specific transcription factor domain
LADLEKSNDRLTRRVAELEALLKQTQRNQSFGISNDPNNALTGLQPSLMADSVQSPVGLGLEQDAHPAQVLIQLRQGQTAAAQMRAEAANGMRLGNFVLYEAVEKDCWATFFNIYHKFLPIIGGNREEHIKSIRLPKHSFLFWTIMVIALRHWHIDMGDSENTIYSQLLDQYKKILLPANMTKPPPDHFTVKAWCLLCYWPLPVTTSAEDLTMTISGIMMKHAMQLGLHRPSHPDDFSRERIPLRQEDINDRLRTWVLCNVVAQNISTGFGQPPDTVYDATLKQPLNAGSDLDWAKLADIRARLEIERTADQVTRTIYTPQENPQSSHGDLALFAKVDILAQSIKDLERIVDLSNCTSLGRITGNRNILTAV